MALNFNGTLNAVPADQLPDGYVAPPVVTFQDYEYKRIQILEVQKDTVHNANKLTTVNNIIGDAGVGLDKQISDILTADYDTVANTVDAYAVLCCLETNVNDRPGGVLYTNGVTNYLCTVNIFVKTS